MRQLPHSPKISAEMRRERSSHQTCQGSSIACRLQICPPNAVVSVAVALQQVVGAHPISRAKTQEYSREPEDLPMTSFTSACTETTIGDLLVITRPPTKNSSVMEGATVLAPFESPPPQRLTRRVTLKI